MHALNAKGVLLATVLEPDLDARSKDEALASLAARLARIEPTVDARALIGAAAQREQQASTVVCAGVAVPHGRMAGLARVVLAVGRSRAGIDWDESGGEPVRLVFLLAGSADAPGTFLKALAAVSAFIRDERCRAELLVAADGDAMLRALHEADTRRGESTR